MNDFAIGYCSSLIIHSSSFMNIIPFPDRAEWPALLARPVQSTQQIEAAVAPILAQVRAGGDAALIELAQKFDKVDLSEERPGGAASRTRCRRKSTER